MLTVESTSDFENELVHCSDRFRGVYHTPRHKKRKMMSY
jgi:hypothetical protein